MVSVEKKIVPKFWFIANLKSSPKISKIFLTIVFLTTLLPSGTDKVMAQTVLSCSTTSEVQEIINTAIADYLQPDNLNVKRTIISNTLRHKSSEGQAESNIQLTQEGVEDEEGNLASALGIIANSLLEEFEQQGLNDEEANAASIATISRWADLPPDSSSMEVVTAIRQASIDAVGEEQAETIEQISDSELLTTLAGLQASSLRAVGLSDREIEAVGREEITPEAEVSLLNQLRNTTQAKANNLEKPEARNKLTSIQTRSELELDNIRQGNQQSIAPGSKLRFKFRLDNPSEEAASVQLPSLETIAENGLTGSATVIGASYRLITAEPGERQQITDLAQDVSIPAGQALDLEIFVEVSEVPEDSISSIEINLQGNCSTSNSAQAVGILPSITTEDDEDDDNELIDPRGQISGCAGEILSDYQGFSVGLYDIDPNDSTESEVGGLTSLTTTELPDDADNNIPAGIEPNIENSNPFFLTNEDEGLYSFLFDEDAGQLDQGRNYVLLVDPGQDSTYDQRRVKITIGDRQERVVEYTATSLDGRPISATDGRTTITGEIVLVENAERVGLNLAVLDLSTNICDAEEISITKTGDRATAEPGDIVLYRIAVRNLASTPLTNFQIIDNLPFGFKLESDSVRGETGSAEVALESSQSDNDTVNFTVNTTLASGETINLVYAAQITPDALRGSAENSAIVNAQRIDNNLTVKDGPAIHNLRLESGIISDSGTLIGRVFVDKNFDGQQQQGEPGIPNAVIYLEDGNRIITDADGLFSVANVLPGYHTGVLDLTSIPEYRLAPNLRFSEENSTSRLVNLEPGGMVRMNFGVTPTAAGKDTSLRRKPSSSDKKTPKTSNSDSDR